MCKKTEPINERIKFSHLFADIQETAHLDKDDFRITLPSCQYESLKNNIKLAEDLNAFAATKNVKGTQLALAWVLAQGENIIPIPGTKTN
jgi:aryl-alcohol dehydrogenase-like predicted oxidoreductase